VTAENPLVRQILEGTSPELRLLAAQGILPLASEELIPLQVMLASDDDAMVANSAREALQSADTRLLGAYLAAEAPAEVLRWFALGHPDPTLVETVLRRRNVPLDLLEEVAGSLGPEQQEVLLLRQDAIVDRPSILDHLEANERLSTFARRRISEYRQHLLPRDTAIEAASREFDAATIAVAELDADDLAEIERVRAEVAPTGEVDHRTGLSEAQIRSLPVPVRIKLCRGASRALRQILIRDSNRLVSLGVLANAAFSEDEIEQVASNRSMDEEVLAVIARRREWVSRYGVCKALVQNPRTPVGLSVRLVTRLSVRDLKTLRRDKNVPEPVRSAADRLYRIKSV
jgi:hypothetical protein